MARLREQYVHIHQAQPVGQPGQFLRRQVAQLRQFLRRADRPYEGFPRGLVRQRQRNGGHVSVLHQPVVHLGQLVRHQAERNVQPLDVRILGPAQQPHQVGALRAGQCVQIARRNQVLRVIEHHADALAARGIILEQVALDESIQQQQHVLRVARPGGRFAATSGKVLSHGLQSAGVSTRQRPQTAAEIVTDHHIPRAEQLRAQELREAAIRRRVVLAGSGRRTQDQIANVAVQYEQAGRARKVQIRQLASPRRIPVRQRSPAHRVRTGTRRHYLGHRCRYFWWRHPLLLIRIQL